MVRCALPWSLQFEVSRLPKRADLPLLLELLNGTLYVRCTFAGSLVIDVKHPSGRDASLRSHWTVNLGVQNLRKALTFKADVGRGASIREPVDARTRCRCQGRSYRP